MIKDYRLNLSWAPCRNIQSVALRIIQRPMNTLLFKDFLPGLFFTFARDSDLAVLFPADLNSVLALAGSFLHLRMPPFLFHSALTIERSE